jgi:hypothetical protein
MDPIDERGRGILGSSVTDYHVFSRKAELPGREGSVTMHRKQSIEVEAKSVKSQHVAKTNDLET